MCDVEPGPHLKKILSAASPQIYRQCVFFSGGRLGSSAFLLGVTEGSTERHHRQTFDTVVWPGVRTFEAATAAHAASSIKAAIIGDARTSNEPLFTTFAVFLLPSTTDSISALIPTTGADIHLRAVWNTRGLEWHKTEREKARISTCDPRLTTK